MKIFPQPDCLVILRHEGCLGKLTSHSFCRARLAVHMESQDDALTRLSRQPPFLHRPKKRSRVVTGTGLKLHLRFTHLLLSVSVLAGAILDSSVSAGWRRSTGPHAFARVLSGTLLSSAWNRKACWVRGPQKPTIGTSSTWWGDYTFQRKGKRCSWLIKWSLFK